jgi:hypothetical protein
VLPTQFLRNSLLFLTIALFAGSAQAQLSVGGYQGLSVSVSPSGTFSVSLPASGGNWGGSTGAKVSNSHIVSGTNGLGSYQQIAFNYSAGASSRSASISVYQNRPLVLFAVTYNNNSANATPFPTFSSYPAGLFHLTYNGEFAGPSFAGFAGDSPFVYFDGSASTVIVSPASDFMLASTTIGSSNQIQSGMVSDIATLPAGMTHQTAFVYGQGINATIATLGKVLTDLSGRQRAASDADILLKSVSYWTDNTATYYYNAGGNSYTGTLEAVKAEFGSIGISLGSMQLDSWWYPKGPDDAWSSHGGIWTYTAAPAIFQPDLATFQANLGVPLITHARWIDANSPYRTQYAMSGNVAIDPQYWTDIAGYLVNSGVAVYEQDWLGADAYAATNLSDPYAFLGNMSTSMAKNGIDMQYCMADPKHFLQGSTYSNLTSIRTSQDGFNSSRWSDFVYASQLAAAVGAWPYADVLMSNDINSLLLATLSAGPIGLGDPLGSISKANLLNAVRADGVIVKPDVPAMPADSVYVNDAQGTDVPMVAWTYSNFGALQADYLFAFVRGTNNQFTVQPSSYGITGAAYLYDYMNQSGQLISAGASVTINLTANSGYYVLAAVGKTGIAFLGDSGQFVTLGKKRIPTLADAGRVDVTVAYSATEKVRTLFGYSPSPVSATALAGSVEAAVWDSSSQLFTVKVHPAKDGTAHLRITQSFDTNDTGSTGACRIRCGGQPGPPPTE